MLSDDADGDGGEVSDVSDGVCDGGGDGVVYVGGEAENEGGYVTLS